MIYDNWLKEGKQGAICFSVDDLHPAQLLRDGYDAGGDLDRGTFKHIDWLLKRHPLLKVTFFTTADWREKGPFPSKKNLAKIPYLRNLFYLAERYPKNYFRLDKYPEFVDFYNNHPQVEIALHGLHHCHKGLRIPVEFQNESFKVFDKKIKQIIGIFESANIDFVRGFTPPAWNATENLMKTLVNNNIKYLASSRDILSPISSDAINSMSGLKGVSIIYPELLLDNKLVHFTSNFQATSDYERAEAIIESNGLLAIKGHIIEKGIGGHSPLDAINESYMMKLDSILSKLEDKYGETLWWTSMSEVTNRISNQIKIKHGSNC